MDVVTDLTARAISCISLLQDMFYFHNPHPKSKQLEDVILLRLPLDYQQQLNRTYWLNGPFGETPSKTSKRFRERVSELRRINGCPLLKEEKEARAWINQGNLLLKWLYDNKEILNQKLSFSRVNLDKDKTKSPSNHKGENLEVAEEIKIQQEITPIEANIHRDPFPAPQQWRVAIQYILYNYPDQRLGLAQALDCIPVLLLLAKYGEHPTIKEQEELRAEFHDRDKEIEDLLKDDKLLREALVEKKIPLPFKMIFQAELEEVQARREKRNDKSELVNKDPFQQAKEMKLVGLALSGGGIRSATFNLGILQGLAKAEYLPRFDYISTVSGGGYIGSWFAAWVKREGLLVKVQDLLNPEKSVNPRGEEVRPIRWLRMFSNYLAPDVSIMSVDSWTMGMTWLRNTLLNQAIILLLICTVLCLGYCGFLIWKDFLFAGKPDADLFFTLLSVLLLTGGALAGWGMRSYHHHLRNVIPKSSALKESENIRFGKFGKHLSRVAQKIETKVTWGLLLLGFLTAFLVSAWFYQIADSNYIGEFSKRFLDLKLVGLIASISLILVAYLGKYQAGLPVDKSGKNIWAQVLLWIFSILAAFFGVLLLAIAWGWIQEFSCAALQYKAWHEINMFSVKYKWVNLINTREFNERIAFILGIPLILEVLSLTVVLRMALLGKYFPDARREWWGRMGGMAHLFIVGWLLVTGSCLLGVRLIMLLPGYLPATTSIWAFLVGLAVKLASGSGTTSPPKASSSIQEKAIGFLVQLGPYLFILGVLIVASTIIYQAMSFTWFGFIEVEDNDPENVLLRAFLLMMALGSLTILLAWRVGVNEFSMHHFYRNRLMRGYLAATRRNLHRKSTANPFTGFDGEDDLKLSLLRTAEGYDGPYPIINTTLNASQVTDLDRQDRQGESFVFTPLYCGFDISRHRAIPYVVAKSYEYAFRPTVEYGYEAKLTKDSKKTEVDVNNKISTPKDGADLLNKKTNQTRNFVEGEVSTMGGPDLSTAMAISGAAANPNQGTHSSPGTAFLMTVFNARLGWWMGNPLGPDWQRSDPKSGLVYLISDLISKTDTRRDFVCLSDGGHFDNMGLYELIRRRVRLIILGDAEQDHLFNCEGLANAIRRCRVDFGVEIEMDISSITNRDEKTKHSECHYAIGTILYPNDPEDKPSGRLLYLKSSLTGDETVDVREYAMGNADFPHQSTADQFFSEDQFESYRKLGLHVIDSALSTSSVQDLFER